jgi:23S rRNA pseudouridine1911/1915/1917 synthase
MSSASLSQDPVDLVVPEEDAGCRLDVFLAKHFTDHSRVQLRRVITAGGVRIGELGGKPSYRLVAGQTVRIHLPPMPSAGPKPEAIPLDVLYEDDWLAVVNKAPGMVVHPARGHWSGTLTSALAHHFSTLSEAGGVSRPGIVHRLDRDTSGVIVIAKNDIAHHRLAAQFADRTIEKQYLAIVVGAPDRDRDIIDRPIGAHPTNRKNMAIRPNDPDSRAAQSYFEVRERFRQFALVAIHPKTGRTHQIRVHLASIGHPVLCDAQYGGRDQITRGELLGGKPDDQVILARQALHAERLSFAHPDDGREITVEAPLPEDMTTVLTALRALNGR